MMEKDLGGIGLNRTMQFEPLGSIINPRCLTQTQSVDLAIDLRAPTLQMTVPALPSSA